VEPLRKPSYWPLVAAVLGLATIVALGAAYSLRRVTSLPGEIAEQGREVLRDLKSVAEGFRTGTVTTSFASYATEVSGTTFLQFATLRQVEVFERKDTSSLLWGQLALPDVVVEARAPVEYTYYLDLNKPWILKLEGETILVAAPPIEFNTPALDTSALHFEVREGSVFRDETAVVEQLRHGLSDLAKVRARQHVALVRETGRRRTEQFVETWLSRAFSDGARHRAKVSFPDEVPSVPSVPPLR
jgi:hypothetical protein